MFFWNCEAANPFDYALIVTTGTAWVYAAWCLIQLRFEHRSPLVWWEPVPFGNADLTPRGRDYHRRFFGALLTGACAILVAVALCAGR